MTHRFLLMSTLLLFGLWSCFSKKPAKPTLEQWVDKTFGGELKYQGSIPDLDPRRIFDHKKKIILSDSQDSLVQLTANAVTSDPDFGLDPAVLRALLAIRRDETAQAKALYAAFAKAGLTDVSIGVIEGHCYILLYSEPDPANRAAMSAKLADILNEQSVLRPEKVWLDWMEPSALNREVGTVIPFGYWHRGDRYHERQRIVFAELDRQEKFSGTVIAAAWKANTGSDRTSGYAKVAFEAARDWAAQNASGANTIQDTIYRVWEDPKHPLLVHYAFPFGAGSPDNQSDEPDGYVTGVFDPDRGTFTGIHVTDTL